MDFRIITPSVSQIIQKYQSSYFNYFLFFKAYDLFCKRNIRWNNYLTIAKLSFQNNLEEQQGFIFRFETWAEIRDSLIETYGQEAESILFKAALNAGRRSAYRRLEIARNKQESLKLLSEYKMSQNWGKIVFSKVDYAKKSGTISITNSFEARKTKSLKPICYFFTGYLKGFLSEIFQQNIDVNEYECKAQNNNKCKFTFNP